MEPIVKGQMRYACGLVTRILSNTFTKRVLETRVPVKNKKERSRRIGEEQRKKESHGIEYRWQRRVTKMKD